MQVLYLLDDPKYLKVQSDSSIELIRTHHSMGDEVFICCKDGISLDQGNVKFQTYPLETTSLEDIEDWYHLGGMQEKLANDFALILIRFEPPVDNLIRNICLILNQAKVKHQVRIFNDPLAIVNLEEKLSAFKYYEFMPKSCVSTNKEKLLDFAKTLSGGCVVKPLNSLGGKSVFAFNYYDSNIEVAIDTLLSTSQVVLVQEKLSAIKEGDRRVFIINGQAHEYMLNRVPKAGSHLGNMLAGGIAKAMPTGEDEKKIANTIGPKLLEQGIIFAGIDVIGGKLTEINITCPTGLKTVKDQINISIATDVINAFKASL